MAEAIDVTNPSKPTATHDPDAILDYVWDWTAWLEPVADDIVSYSIICEDGMTLVSSSATANAVTAFLSFTGDIDAAQETKPTATCRIVTTGGRTDDRTIYFKIKER